MIGFFLVMLMPIIAGLLISHFMLSDKKEDQKRERLEKGPYHRMFRVRKSIKILCKSHLSTLANGEVALVDQTRCKICIDKQGKV